MFNLTSHLKAKKLKLYVRLRKLLTWLIRDMLNKKKQLTKHSRPLS